MSHLSPEQLHNLVAQAAQKVQIGKVYRHKNGNRYEVLDIVLLEGSDSPAVLYRATTDPIPSWVRPVDNFLEKFTMEDI